MQTVLQGTFPPYTHLPWGSQPQPRLPHIHGLQLALPALAGSQSCRPCAEECIAPGIAHSPPPRSPTSPSSSGLGLPSTRGTHISKQLPLYARRYTSLSASKPFLRFYNRNKRSLSPVIGTNIRQHGSINSMVIVFSEALLTVCSCARH